MPTRIINVANRLPVTVGEQIKKSSGGLVAALEGLPRDQYTLEWLGWPGGVVEEGRRAEVERILREQYGATPVYLTDEEEDGFYNGFSNGSLWPVLHYMADRMHYEQAWWDLYRLVNQRFCQRVLDIAHDGDLVWVHDYQLMLLPAMLKEARPRLRIGFFLHTPFPSYEVFRVHPRREELLRGMLGADQIGFHTPGYLRHFRSAVIRIAGLAPEISSVRVGGRTSYFGTYPIGIHAAKFEQELSAPAHAAKVRELRNRHPGKHLVVSVERMDYTKGILNRLEAIDLFLKSYPPAQRNTVEFIFVSVPSREDVPEYKELREQVESHVGRLNGQYATLEGSPINFIHGSVQFPDLCALYAAAEVGLVTPLMDGMNLVAKEYVACHKDTPGVLILSEFAGAVEELFSALIVNPYDAKAVADAIADGLAMDDGEKRARMEPIRKRVMNYDSPWWARAFVQDLLGRDIRCASRRDIHEAQQKLCDAVQAHKKVAMFLDYDGTLREIVRDPAMAGLTPAIRRVLDLLKNTPTIDTTIISGRKRQDLERFVGEYPFGLIAEHGADIRRPGQREWEQLDRNMDYSWKPEVAKVLQHYTDSTPGSWIEEKRSSLVWHYRMVEAEYGQWRAKELTSELTTLTQNEQVQVRHGNKIVEIAAARINKGDAVRQLIENTSYDLIVCAGDDQTDESMFALTLPNMLTIKVGAGDTRAEYAVSNPAELRNLLERAISGK